MKRGLNQENSLPDPEFGRESSESARAIHYVVQKDTLMTYVSARFAQADPGIVSGSTIERKKMSTKTIYKRIALVAVASLGFGVLTSVSPANAAVTGSQNAFVVRSDDATYASQPGDANTTTAAVTITEGGGAELNGKFIRVTYKATSTSTAIKLTTANIADSAVTALTGGVTLTMDASGTGGISYTASTEAVASTSQNGGTIILKVGRAAVPGIYTLSIDAANTFATAADSANFSKSITVTGAPTSISVVGTGTTNTNTVIAGNTTSNYTVSVKDSAGNATYLLATERLNLTENGTGLSVTTPGLAVITNAELASTQSTMSTTVTLTTASLAAGTYTLTVTPVGLATSVAAATGSLVYTTTASRVAAVSIGLTSPTTQVSGSATAVLALPAAAATTVDSNYYTNTSNNSFTFRIKAAAAATGFVQYSVAATGVTTTPAAGNYTAALTVDATASYADITVTTSSVALDGNFVVTAWEDGDAGDPSNTVTYKTPVFSGVKFSNPDAAEIAVKIGTTTTLQAKAVDQYGNAMANTTLYFDIAGRSTTAVFARVTDASGLASVPFVDSSTSTSALTDTVKVDDTSGGDSSNDKIDTITLAYATDISATTMTASSFINASGTYSGTLKADGTTEVTIDATNTSATYTDQFYMAVTMKNAAEAVVRGIPVVFTVTGGAIAAEADTSAAAITVGTSGVTTVTVYTDSNGVARAAVQVTTVGPVKITATQGTLTQSASVTAIAGANTTARTIAATIVGSLVSATVKDGYGNGVPGVAVSLSASGGTFQTGSNTVSATTDSKGVATASLSPGGAVSVKATVTTAGTQIADAAATPVTNWTAGVASATATATSVVTADNTTLATLTTLINSLLAKINALSKLVAKIQKKVNA
jgi:hypothetical protein